jgi:hypothetical protein
MCVEKYAVTKRYAIDAANERPKLFYEEKWSF